MEDNEVLLLEETAENWPRERDIHILCVCVCVVCERERRSEVVWAGAAHEHNGGAFPQHQTPNWTLHPTLYTLSPTPYTLNPKP